MNIPGDTRAHSANGVAPATSPSHGASAPVGDSTSEAQALSGLQRRRDELAEQVIELHWDLGGLAYEMAIRDHFRLDVLVRRAALLQERDAELAEIERLLRMEESASAGLCPACSAPHSRGAVFCWQCGTNLMERLPSAATSDSAASVPGKGDIHRDAGAPDDALGRPPDTGDAATTLVMDPVSAPEK